MAEAAVQLVTLLIWCVRAMQTTNDYSRKYRSSFPFRTEPQSQHHHLHHSEAAAGISTCNTTLLRIFKKPLRGRTYHRKYRDSVYTTARHGPYISRLLACEDGEGSHVESSIVFDRFQTIYTRCSWRVISGKRGIIPPSILQTTTLSSSLSPPLPYSSP